MEFNTKNTCCPVYDDALIEVLQMMDDELFYKKHDEEFDYYEQHLTKIKQDRGNVRYIKLKCSHYEQNRYAQKMAIKHINAEQKKINDTYARNRRDARNAVLQETKEPVHDEVDTLVKDSYWVKMDEEIDWNYYLLFNNNRL
jgi:hypothetical protein